jgi:hypothetical protein
MQHSLGGGYYNADQREHEFSELHWKITSLCNFTTADTYCIQHKFSNFFIVENYAGFIFRQRGQALNVY